MREMALGPPSNPYSGGVYIFEELVQISCGFILNTDLLNVIYKIGQISSNCMSVLAIEEPTITTFSIFGVSFPSILSTEALSVKLNTKVLITFVKSHTCAPVYRQIHFCPNYLWSEIGVIYGQSTISNTVMVTSNWLKAW